MTTTATEPLDVNSQFISEKLAQMKRREDRNAWLQEQVEAGNMVRQGNRYIVTVGWDAGEAFSADSLIPVTGLDLRQDGSQAFASRVPSWHSLGQTLTGNETTAAEILEAGGQLFRVGQEPTSLVLRKMAQRNRLIINPTTRQRKPVTVTEETLDIRAVESSFINYREDNGNPLGVVGNRYTPMQNLDAYNFLDELLNFGMVAETIGTFNGGKRVFISARLPEDVIIDPNGVKDLIRPYLNFINSHDGTTAVMLFLSPWRIQCKNTERLALANAETMFKIKHTKNATEKIAEARKALGFTLEYFKEFESEETHLLNTPIKDLGEVERLMDEVWEFDPEDAAKATKTRRDRRNDRIFELFALNGNRMGRNAYALERAATDVIDHETVRKGYKGSLLEAQGNAILMGSDDKTKNTLHSRLMALRTR